MNILSDFAERLRHAVPDTDNNEVKTLKDENALLQSEVTSLKKQLVKAGVEPEVKKAPARRKAAPKAADAEKKPATKRASKKSDPKA